MKGVLWLLLLVLLQCATSHSLQSWCQGRIVCSDEDLDTRVCVVAEASLDLTVSPESDVYLTNSHPVPVALAVGSCDEPRSKVPLLRNAFGVMASSKVYGELELSAGVAAVCESEGAVAECHSLHTHADLETRLVCVLERSSSVTVMLNRDMTGNIFHILYNTMYPLFRVQQRLGVDYGSNQTRVAVVDPMPLSSVETDLLSAILKGSRIDRIASNSVQCFPALAVGGERAKFLCFVQSEGHSQPIVTGERGCIGTAALES